MSEIILEPIQANQIDFLTDHRSVSLYYSWLKLGNAGTMSDFLEWMRSGAMVEPEFEEFFSEYEDYLLNLKLLPNIEPEAGSPSKYLNEQGEWVEIETEISHDNTTDKNGNPNFQHLDSVTEKAIPIDADSVGLWDSVTVKFVRLTIANFKTFLSSFFARFGGNSIGAKQVIGTNDNQDFGIKTNGVVRVTVTNGGNVGIGKDVPLSPLVVATGANEMRFGESNGRTLSAYFNGNLANFDFVAVQTYFNSDFLIGSNKVIKTANESTSNLYLSTSSPTKAVYTDRNLGVGVVAPRSKLDVAGAIQIADDTAAASETKKGATRYRETANASYIEQCMKTGATTYEWKIIKQNTW